jgi:hypothetical protein
MTWALATSLSSSGFGQTTPLLDAKFVEAIRQEISGDLAKQHIQMMAPFERNRPESEYTGDFLETKYMIEKMSEYGFSGVEVEKTPVDTPLWDAESGELWMEEPVRERIANCAEISAALAPGSGTVDVRAELVSIGSGLQPSDYKGKDVRGKVVLVTGRIEQAYKLAVSEHGAVGIVYYNNSLGQKHPKQIRWQRLIRSGTLPPGKPAFGFAVSSLVGARMAALLESGQRVVLHAKTKTRTFPGKYETVTGEIPGETFPNDKFLFIGHLFERIAKQGANDNLSGPAAQLEIGRALLRLQKQGRIPKFRRPVRFLWPLEGSGTRAYLEAHPDEKKKLRAAINMDMVGEGLVETHGVFHVSATPYSQPHFINDVVRSVAEMTILMNNDANARFPGNRYGQYANKLISPTGSDDIFWCDFLPYDGGSDSGLLNRAEFGIPTAYFEVWPDDYYHSNEDVAAHSDATQLKRVAFMGAVAAAIYATATPESVARALPEFVGRCQGRIAAELKRAGNLLAASNKGDELEAYRLAHVILEEAHEREAKVLESLTLLSKGSDEVTEQTRAEAARIRSDLQRSLAELRRFYRFECKMREVPEATLSKTELERRLAKLVPVRLKRDEGAADSRKGNTVVSTRYAAYELFNYMDGERSIYEIWRKLFAEFGNVTLTDVEDFVTAHVKAGNIRIP